jgi:hypothetical protein
MPDGGADHPDRRAPPGATGMQRERSRRQPTAAAGPSPLLKLVAKGTIWLRVVDQWGLGA